MVKSKTGVQVSSLNPLCPGVRGPGESEVWKICMMIPPDHSLDVNDCARSCQRNHSLLDLYKEDIHCP